MITNRLRPFVPAALLFAAPVALSAAEHHLLPEAARADLAIRGALVADAAAVEADRAPVAVSWTLAGEELTPGGPAPFVAASREHWLHLSAAELERGVDPAIASPGAILRLSPLVARSGEAPAPIDPARIEIISAGGEIHRGLAAAGALAGEAELAEAGAEFPAASVALRLREELGAGPFRLRLAGAKADANTGYLLHVFEPASPIVLELGADRAAYASGGAGGAGALELALLSHGRRLEVDDSIVGVLVSPSGRVESLRFAPAEDGRWRAEFSARGESGAAGLWQAEVAVTSGLRGRTTAGGASAPVTRRNARTAFAVALPTAALAGSVELASPAADGARRIAVPVEVGSPGRYTARATLARRDAEGRLVGVARGESSAWLERGAGEIVLAFDAASLVSGMDSKGGGAFELVELELADPGRMGLLERRALALPLPPR